MKPLLVIDGRPRLYEGELVRSVDFEDTPVDAGPNINIRMRRVVPGSPRLAVITRNGYGLTLRNVVRSMRPSGRVMLSGTTDAWWGTVGAK